MLGNGTPEAVPIQSSITSGNTVKTRDDLLEVIRKKVPPGYWIKTLSVHEDTNAMVLKGNLVRYPDL